MSDYKYNIMPYDLTDGLNVEVPINGNLIYLKETTSSGVFISVQPDSRSNDKISLYKGYGLKTDFKKFFITADAQPGKTCEIMVTADYDKFTLFDNVQNPTISVDSTLNVSVGGEVLNVAERRVASIPYAEGSWKSSWILTTLTTSLGSLIFDSSPDKQGYYNITMSITSYKAVPTDFLVGVVHSTYRTDPAGQDIFLAGLSPTNPIVYLKNYYIHMGGAYPDTINAAFIKESLTAEYYLSFVFELLE